MLMALIRLMLYFIITIRQLPCLTKQTGIYHQDTNVNSFRCTYTVQFQYNIFFYNTEQVQLAYIARNSKMHY